MIVMRSFQWPLEVHTLLCWLAKHSKKLSRDLRYSISTARSRLGFMLALLAGVVVPIRLVNHWISSLVEMRSRHVGIAGAFGFGRLEMLEMLDFDVSRWRRIHHFDRGWMLDLTVVWWKWFCCCWLCKFTISLVSCLNAWSCNALGIRMSGFTFCGSQHRSRSPVVLSRFRFPFRSFAVYGIACGWSCPGCYYLLGLPILSSTPKKKVYWHCSVTEWYLLMWQEMILPWRTVAKNSCLHWLMQYKLLKVGTT